MHDLTAGVLIILGGSAGLTWCGWKIARRPRRRLAFWVGLLALAFVLAFSLLAHGTLLVAQIVPFSNAIVLGNWIPLGAGLIAGIVMGHPRIPKWRGTAFALLLLGVAWHSVFCNFLGAAPPTRDSRVVNGVAMQSQDASCSTCCAATLLRHCGIPADEGEMIRLCLTDTKGTPRLGLYRGLKIKTADTDWEVEVVRCSTKELCEADRWPVLLCVRLDDPKDRWGFRDWWKWPAPLRHAVVMFGITEDGRAEIGDPAIPNTRRCLWTLDEVEAKWSGEGLRLVRRAG